MNLSEEYKRTTGNSPTGAWFIDVMNTKLAVEWNEEAGAFVSLIHISDTQGYEYLVKRMGAAQCNREKRKVQDHDGPRAVNERRHFSEERLWADRMAYHMPVLDIVQDSVKSAIKAVHEAADGRLAAAIAVGVALGRAGSGTVAHGPAADDVVHEDASESDCVSLSDHVDAAAADNDAASVTFEAPPGSPVPPGRPLKPWDDSEDHIYGYNLAGDGMRIPKDYIPWTATLAAQEPVYLTRNRTLFEGGGGGGGSPEPAGSSHEDEDALSDADGDIALPAAYRELTVPHLYPGELPCVNHCQGDSEACRTVCGNESQTMMCADESNRYADEVPGTEIVFRGMHQTCPTTSGSGDRCNFRWCINEMSGETRLTSSEWNMRRACHDLLREHLVKGVRTRSNTQ